MTLKKIIAVLIAAVIAVSLAPVNVFADSEGIFTYTVENGEAHITAVNYAGHRELTIPDTLGGYPVRGIRRIGDTYSFGTANMVETLFIPAGVTVMGYAALRNFDCAKVVVDEDNPNYSSDEYGVLFNKDKTVLVSCPCSLHQKEYVLPETVKTIDYCAFEKCAFIEKIVLPEGLESLGNQSFCQMPQLREINIPEGITELGQNMFIQCRSLEEIKLPSTLTKVSNSSLSETPLKSVVVPDGVTSIDTFAFESCKKLEYVELPATLRSIGYEVFENCDSLKYIFYRGSEEDWASISINASNTDDLEIIKTVYNYSPESGYEGINYSFDNGVLTLGGGGAVPAFLQGDYRYWDIYSALCRVIVVDGNITGIGSYAFENFTELEYVIIYAENINIADYAFSACPALDNVIIASSANWGRLCFNASENVRVFFDNGKNPKKAAENGSVGFSCSEGVLNFDGDVDFDLLHLFSFVSAIGRKAGEIKKITFNKLTFKDIELSYISQYEKGEPVIEKIEGNTLVNGEITVRSVKGEEMTFNELVDEIADGSAEGFVLIASDENHKTVSSQIEVEGPENSDDTEEPEEQNGFLVFFEKVKNGFTKALKWAVTLLNKLFKAISGR